VNHDSKTSKGEKELAKNLKPYGFTLNDRSFMIGRFFPDIFHSDQKIIVEFYGDFFHMNPKIYQATDMMHQKSALEIWKLNSEREDLFEHEGWKVFIVWESDWKNSPQEVLHLISEELQQRNPML
jgi:G:T-mismatch repair DNA endonuclease (very short patch repair protein)